MAKMTANRYHDISCGHRVVGHEGKCRHLHGHNHRIHFECAAESGGLDDLGRVIDFGEIKNRLCSWLEENWDHKFLAWDNDGLCTRLYEEECQSLGLDETSSFIFVPFNPTAENMAHYLAEVVAPMQLEGTGIVVTKIVIEETRKCSVTYCSGG